MSKKHSVTPMHPQRRGTDCAERFEIRAVDAQYADIDPTVLFAVDRHWGVEEGQAILGDGCAFAIFDLNPAPRLVFPAMIYRTLTEARTVLARLARLRLTKRTLRSKRLAFAFHRHANESPIAFVDTQMRVGDWIELLRESDFMQMPNQVTPPRMIPIAGGQIEVEISGHNIALHLPQLKAVTAAISGWDIDGLLSHELYATWSLHRDDCHVRFMPPQGDGAAVLSYAQDAPQEWHLEAFEAAKRYAAGAMHYNRSA